MSKLEEIVTHKRQEVAEAKKTRPLAQLEQALKRRLPHQPFRQAVVRPGVLSLIAEFKRASPSAGPIRPQADPVEVAQAYQKAGAQALSVLTDSRFFLGSLKDLTAVKEQVPLPVLRKDFLLEEYQVVEAASAGADAVLLIVAILERQMLRRLLGLARDLDLDALVEVHTERELGEALDLETELIGINNRDLNTFGVDLKTTERLRGKIPPGKGVVAESGIHSHEEVELIRRWGADAVLIGEELMSAKEMEVKVKELMGWPRPSSSAPSKGCSS